MMRNNLVKVLDMYPNIFYAKHFDYKAKKVDNHYEIYRREIEGAPWELYSRCAIVDGILFTNWQGLWDNERKEKHV